MQVQDKNQEEFSGEVITDVTSFYSNQKIFSQAKFESASRKGLKFVSSHPPSLTQSDLSQIIGWPVELFLSGYELMFHGVITEIRVIKKNLFEVYVGFTKNTPMYYKRCIEELLN